jgi:hypothetical protein
MNAAEHLEITLHKSTGNAQGANLHPHLRLVADAGRRVATGNPTDDRGIGTEKAHSVDTASQAARSLGAIALLVMGGVHLEQYVFAFFSEIPTIGSLFLLNFVGGTVLGLVLLIPLPARVGARRLVFDSVTAAAGIGLASGAFAGLLISEDMPLFGFMEHGYRPEIVVALAAEAVTIFSLGFFLLRSGRRLRELRGDRPACRTPRYR